MLLSFIIPVYNCKQYLEQNLEIIYGSDLDLADFEIVLIDDESSDGSSCICQRYVEAKKNVQYVWQKNQGPATARNTGLDHAKGDYVWFVDADDKIEPNILPKLKTIIEEKRHIDFISFGYVTQYPGLNETTRISKEIKYCSGIEFLQMPHHGSYLWNNIYRRSAIGNLRMLDGVSHIEDFCFNYQAIARFECVAIIPDVGYYYNKLNVSSISNRKNLRDRVKANGDSYKVYRTLHNEMLHTQDKDYRALLEKELNFSVNAHIFTIMKFDNVKTVKKYIKQYREMELYPIQPTGNFKGDIFLRIANHEWLLVSILRLCIFLKKLKFLSAPNL